MDSAGVRGCRLKHFYKLWGGGGGGQCIGILCLKWLVHKELTSEDRKLCCFSVSLNRWQVYTASLTVDGTFLNNLLRSSPLNLAEYSEPSWVQLLSAVFIRPTPAKIFSLCLHMVHSLFKTHQSLFFFPILVSFDSLEGGRRGLRNLISHSSAWNAKK